MANTGGKIYVAQPIMFASEVVSIGDVSTDANGGPTQVVVVGAGAIAEGPLSVVVGAGAGVVGGSQESTVLGYQARSQFGAPLSITIGAGAVSQFGAPSSVNIGHGNQMQGGQQYVAIGTFRSGFSGIGTSAYLGTGDTSAQNGGNNLCLGTFALNEVGTGFTLIGGAIVSGGGAGDHSVIGEGALAAAGGGRSLVIGSGAQADSSQQLVIGSGAAAINGTADAICLGYQATCTGYGGIALGAFTSIGLGCNLDIAIGQHASLASATNSIAIGSNATVTSGSATLALGYASSSTSAPHSIAIGTYATVAADTCIAIGATSQVSSQYSLSIGSGIIDNLSPRSISLGFDGHITNSPYSILYSAYNLPSEITDVAGFSTCIGYVSIITLASYSLAVGTALRIEDTAITDPTSLGAHVVVGLNSVMHDGSQGSSALGLNILIERSSQALVLGENLGIQDGNYAVTVGRGNSLTVSVDNAISVGIYQAVDAPQTITLGTFTENHVANNMEIGSSIAHVAIPAEPAGTGAIHSMVVKGYNGGALATVSVNDAPSNSGDTGLTVVCNVATVLSNKTVHALVAPAPGALYLYIIP
jgi:hypothetical protein